jgi:phenylalanine ammonia-lyase
LFLQLTVKRRVTNSLNHTADTRTADHDSLGLALLQHQHAGVLPSALADIADSNAATGSSNVSPSSAIAVPLPLTPPLSTSSMPPSWVRAALVVRLNSLLRGHSAASLPLLGSMSSLLEKNVTPMVPLRGTISASGDLSPLSYVAGTRIGERGIFCWAPSPEKPLGLAAELNGVGIGNGMEGMEGAAKGLRIMRASDALPAFGLTPLKLRPKEHLAILNGTAFSCGVAALCVVS